MAAMEVEQRWRALQAAKVEDARRMFEERGVVTAADFFEACVDDHPGQPLPLRQGRTRAQGRARAQD
jgi:hypothetical protein